METSLFNVGRQFDMLTKAMLHNMSKVQSHLSVFHDREKYIRMLADNDYKMNPFPFHHINFYQLRLLIANACPTQLPIVHESTHIYTH